MQGGGAHPPHEETFFVTSKPPSEQGFLNIFKAKPHTPLAPAMLQWLILNINQTLQAIFLLFYNHLVSQVRDLMGPWNF